MAGRIEVIAGCMFSGKTSVLIDRLVAARAGGAEVAAFKHCIDRRYDFTKLATHDGRRLDAAPVATPEELLERASGAAVVGVDEAHFFGRGLLPAVERMRARGQRVILAGIDHDAWGRPFPPLPQLKEIADEVALLSTPCRKCGEPARFSQRMTPVMDELMVGGPGDYEPRCRACFQALPGPGPDY